MLGGPNVGPLGRIVCGNVNKLWVVTRIESLNVEKGEEVVGGGRGVEVEGWRWKVKRGVKNN